MNFHFYPYPIATGPMDCGHGRRCGIWISWWVRETVILDTRALKKDELLHAGRDTFPEDCVLVVVSPAENRRLTEIAEGLQYPVSGPVIAAKIINEACRRDPKLAAQIGWVI